MSKDFDVCVIGSGAGGGPVALTLAEAGYSVVVIEKGPWLREGDFCKDEIAATRRSTYTPNLRDERHVLEQQDDDGAWQAESTSSSGWDFWNGNLVGGATNLMSGFFHRMKPVDFRLRSEFGPVEGGNVVDWPIEYADLEPYYDRVERRVGVSGRVVPHPQQEPRSSPEFPYPPTVEHPVSERIDRACRELGYHPLPVPRAILPFPAMGRLGCAYTDYCGSYGCSTGAKGSSRAALLDQAVGTGRCEIRPRAMATRLVSDQQGRVEALEYIGADGERRRLDARVYVVACQAIESARLLLMSPGPRHPMGLGNNSGQLGRNLIFSSGGVGSGDLRYAGLAEAEVLGLKSRGLFVNRALQDWYLFNDPTTGARTKGGTIEFLFRHSNGIAQADVQKRDADGNLIWGKPLKDRIKAYFTEGRHLRFEVFSDWTPVDDCHVTPGPRGTRPLGPAGGAGTPGVPPPGCGTGADHRPQGGRGARSHGGGQRHLERQPCAAPEPRGRRLPLWQGPGDIGPRPGLPRTRGREPVCLRRQLHAHRRQCALYLDHLCQRLSGRGPDRR